jgi:predicted acylesterase/phospholipase RssA
VDFDAIRNAHCPIKLFLSATNVRTTKIRVFDNNEIGPDAVLASACLPFSSQAIEIDGEHYWDDRYMGNPAISHLFITVTAETSLIKKTWNVDRNSQKRLPKLLDAAKSQQYLQNASHNC